MEHLLRGAPSRTISGTPAGGTGPVWTITTSGSVYGICRATNHSPSWCSAVFLAKWRCQCRKSERRYEGDLGERGRQRTQHRSSRLPTRMLGRTRGQTFPRCRRRDVESVRLKTLHVLFFSSRSEIGSSGSVTPGAQVLADSTSVKRSPWAAPAPDAPSLRPRRMKAMPTASTAPASGPAR